MLSSILRIQDLHLQIRLGCTPGERVIPQEVRVSFEIKFRELPRACETDALEDTVCYESLISAIHHFTRDREFHTVEFLAMACLKEVEKIISRSGKVKITLHKPKPPIASLEGGVLFELESDSTS